MKKTEFIKIIQNSIIEDINFIQNGQSWIVKNLIGIIKESNSKGNNMTEKALDNILEKFQNNILILLDKNQEKLIKLIDEKIEARLNTFKIEILNIIDERFTCIEKRLDKIEKRLDIIEIRLDKIEARMDYNNLLKLPE